MGQERKPVVDRFHLTHIQVLITVLITIRDVPGEPPPAVEQNANTSGAFSRGGGADETFGGWAAQGKGEGLTASSPPPGNKPSAPPQYRAARHCIQKPVMP